MPIVSDRKGGVTVILASALFMLAGAATVAVDLGSVYLARRQLQGMADAAALAAADGGRSAVEALLRQNNVSGVSIATIEQGDYRADASIAVDNRFVVNATNGTAMRVELQQRAPLFFGRLLVGRDGVDLRARAVARRTNAAAFSLSTGLASLSGGLPNMLLSSLAGTQLNLSIMDVQGLASLNLDLLGFADALKVRTGRDGQSYGELFDAEIPLSDIIGAMADSGNGSSSAAVLLGVAGRVAGRSLRLSDIIDLGPMKGAASSTGQPNIALDSLAMLRMVLSPPSQTAVPMDLSVTVPGLTSTHLMLVTNSGQVRSPMLTVTDNNDIVLRTGQMRLYLDSSVAAVLPGIASVRVPLYVEAAAAEARLSDIECASGSVNNGVTLAVTPSIGTAALADVDAAALTNFSSPPNAQPAILAQTLGTKVTGYANIALGGLQSQPVHFTPGEISAHTVKSVSTNDLARGVAGSLMHNSRVNVSLLGINVPASPLIAPVTALLGTTAPLLDDVLNSITATLGIRLGTANVQVHDIRCGLASVVA